MTKTLNPLDDHLGYQLRRASTQVMADLADRLAELRLTVVETSVLVLIAANPGVTQSDIGRVLGIKRANMAPLVATLEQRHLVRRGPAAGRQVGLATTATGATIAQRAEAIMHLSDEAVFGALSLEQQSALRTMLQTLRRQPGG